MAQGGLIQIALYLALLTIIAVPLGRYIANVYAQKSSWFSPALRPVENFIYRACNIDKNSNMNWKTYAIALILFNLVGFCFLYFLQRYQAALPLNPNHMANVSPDMAFNTAASFVTNTNWQSYQGENTMSYLTQMLGLTVQNFVSAATGMVTLLALIRGITQKETDNLGNFWVDLIRTTLYILLPVAAIIAILLISEGVIQTLEPNVTITTVQHAKQVIPLGPTASQVAIKQLGTNGGGFFGANAAHPFENSTPFSNFIELLAFLIIPVSLCFTFGKMIKDRRQGIAIFITMAIIFVPCILFCVKAEQSGNPLLQQFNVAQSGNMEGKETRFGIVNSALWATCTTSSSTGSVNAALDSFTPLGGMIPMWLMQLGEIVYGGVGSGLYGMLIIIILTVFVAGLMVGRTPEYLGKKIEIFDMKMACIATLVPHLLILLLTAIAAGTHIGTAAILNKGPHGFSEILYAFTSSAANNGSAFGGLNSNTIFYNILCGLTMLSGRFFIIIPVLAIAGSLARKKNIPITAGTIRTHTPLFIILTVIVIIIIGALTFFPALALGPIIEHLMLYKL